MASFELREYQQRSLDALAAYFRLCVELGDADMAFYTATRQWEGQGRPYAPVAELPGLPYICLRIPTGGGKTFVACHALALTRRELLQTDHTVVLWLTPSNAICSQTLQALRDRQHPYRRALEAGLGPVAVLDITEALYITRATLDTQTTIIVSTIQAFRVEHTEGRKVYENNGALMDHFKGFSPDALAGLERYENGTPLHSLANVLRLRRPLVLVDEAHNARTDLSFTTLARFQPACILELTATPDREKQPSNVLYSVSAAELKAEAMIKLPIVLYTRPDWRELLTAAIARLDALQHDAETERQRDGRYIRPIMLLQAQPRAAGNQLTVDEVERVLLEDFKIPKAQIARATGSDNQLDGVDILAEECPIRFVITVQALREGWDCPFAYVLTSVAEMRSSTAVEQILGRVMRLPYTRRKEQETLNRAYAYAASANFHRTATALVDGLVQNGFERLTAQELVRADPAETLPLSDDHGPLYRPDSFARRIETGAPPDMSGWSPELAAKVEIDASGGALSILAPINETELEMLAASYADAALQKKITRTIVEAPGLYQTRAPAESGARFALPVLAYAQGDWLEEFDRTHILEYEWRLAQMPAALDASEFSLEETSAGALIDLDKEERVSIRFLPSLHHQTRLLATDTDWSVPELVWWLDRQIPHPDIVQSETDAFLTRLIHYLLEERGFTLEQLVYHKYRLRKAVEDKIDAYRKTAETQAYQQFLLETSPLTVTPACVFEFEPNAYPYRQPYAGRYQFRKHYYPIVGDLPPNGEEEACARFLDELPAVETWVRNLERTRQAFSLQTATDRFYPDFVCRLTDGRYLVVEYKGEHLWSNDDSREKRTIGELWARRSQGACLFVMPPGMALAQIEQAIDP